jgi:hypothetical protein
MMKAGSVRRFLAVTCLALIPAGLFAQATGTTTGDIRGRVTDESGAVVSDVVVEATSRDTGFSRSDTTRPDGTFVIRLLPPGLYRLSVSRKGFRTGTVDEVRVVLGASTSLSIGLEIERVQESVTIAAQSGLIDPASTQLSKTIDETKIRHLPINQLVARRPSRRSPRFSTSSIERTSWRSTTSATRARSSSRIPTSERRPASPTRAASSSERG